MATQKKKNLGGRPLTFQGPLADLVAHFGSEEACAEELGASSRSLRRWASGQGRPNRASAKLLLAVAAKRKIPNEKIAPILDGNGSK